jgi:DNA-binding response OmpR family regulator
MTQELEGKKVLLVDDDRDILAAMSIALKETGADICIANDGNEALAQAENNSPDLVVLDMMLPKRSGFLVMEKLRRGKSPGDPPRVIMITGNQGTRHKVYAKNLGVDAYINKPFRMERLVDSVMKVLGGDSKTDD